MPTSRFARRITDTSEKSYGMVALAMAEKGPLIHLELGRPMYDTPLHIKQATIDALLAGDVHYSDLQGLPELREALATKLLQQNALQVDASQIIVTNGLTQASFAAFMALLDADDEAILLDPFYPQHIGKIEFAGATPVIASLDPADNFSIKRELIEAHITERTKVIVLVNPCNPTGRVYSREELSIVAELALEHDLVVITDEVYEQITFDGAQHISIATLPGMAERTITMQAFTKAYAMDGWRIGYLVVPGDFVEPLMKVTTTEVTHVNTFIQHGAIAALQGSPEPLSEMVEGDHHSRNLVVQRLNQMPGVTCATPEGTIYAFPDISATGLDSDTVAMRLMREAGVVVESGRFYGSAGEGHLRICFGAQPQEVLTEAMNRLQNFFNKL